MGLRDYARLYLALISSRIRAQMQYRVSFALDTLGTFLINFTDLLSIWVIMMHTPTIGGWTLGEVALLYGLVTASFGLHELVQGAYDADVFSDYIQRGLFDQMLIRPAPVVFQMLTEFFPMRRLGRITQGALALGLGLGLSHLQWTLGKALFLPIVIAGGVVFFLAISIVGCTLCFWTVKSTEVVNIFTYGGQALLSYPISIYQQWMRQFFTFVLPMAFINYFPTLYLLDKPDPFNLPPFTPFLAPVVCSLVFLLSVRVWRFGVARYQSTGS